MTSLRVVGLCVFSLLLNLFICRLLQNVFHIQRIFQLTSLHTIHAYIDACTHGCQDVFGSVKRKKCLQMPCLLSVKDLCEWTMCIQKKITFEIRRTIASLQCFRKGYDVFAIQRVRLEILTDQDVLMNCEIRSTICGFFLLGFEGEELNWKCALSIILKFIVLNFLKVFCRNLLHLCWELCSILLRSLSHSHKVTTAESS